MDQLGPIRAYWKTVEDCLIELFQLPRVKAREDIASLRHRLDSKGANTRSQQDIIYHAEPLHIAEDLSRTPRPSTKLFLFVIARSETVTLIKVVRRADRERR